ncbi:unnamed protein product [Nyctereutes procyonoides]|uniref:Zinc finger CCHC domain-containing protein 17 n=1 Tax=Nyctereutes procyonoides TaxID=34880 RepID=A0A811YNC6_NYCPR|nr:unnamed protein product [Nyctereutes procyonoides]
MSSGRPETMENLPALYTIFQGEQGLVHRTHMSSCRVDKPSEIVDVGDKVWVKLIGWEMKNDRIKVSLSMKVVNQGTGKDLDPNNVIIEQEERQRRSFQDYPGQKITPKAVLNNTCKKRGCKRKRRKKTHSDRKSSDSDSSDSESDTGRRARHTSKDRKAAKKKKKASA